MPTLFRSVGLTSLACTTFGIAGVNEIRLDQNPITGATLGYIGNNVYGCKDGFDSDMSGFTAFCESMKSSAVSTLSVSGCGIGPVGLTTLASVISDTAGLNDITIDSTGNLEDQKKYTITGLQGGGASSLDFSSLNFGPADLKFLATLFTSFPSFNALLSEVNLSANKCFGSKPDPRSPRRPHIHDIDKDQSGWIAFCEALPSTKVQTLVLSDTGLGSVGLTTFASMINDMAGLSEVDLENNTAIEVAELEALRKSHPNIKFTM